MLVLQWIGIGLLIVLAAGAALVVRRAVVVRAGGTIKLTLRLTTLLAGRGWSPGLGRFAGEELRWYRLFSFAFRPRRVLSRHGLLVLSRRLPTGTERLALPADWVILRCMSDREPVEIAMASTTVTGFLSWLEAAPPGAVSSRLATH
jgi:hypothetical protein